MDDYGHVFLEVLRDGEFIGFETYLEHLDLDEPEDLTGEDIRNYAQAFESETTVTNLGEDYRPHFRTLPGTWLFYPTKLCLFSFGLAAESLSALKAVTNEVVEDLKYASRSGQLHE